MVGMDDHMLDIPDQNSIRDRGKDGIQLRKLAVLFGEQQVGLVLVFHCTRGGRHQSQGVDVIALDRHHQPQDAKQTAADIKDGGSRPGRDVKLPGKMLPARHLDRHALGQCQANGGGADPLLRQDRAPTGTPPLHDTNDLFIPHHDPERSPRYW